MLNKNVVIKKATPDNAEALLNIYTYYVTNTAISFEYDVPTVEEFRNRIVKTLANYPYLVAEIESKIVGYTYAGPFVGREAYKYSAELTIYINHDLLGEGIGGKLYKALEDELESKGIFNLYACIGYPDVEDEYLTMNSINFHKHLGFEICGRFQKCGYKFNRWYNMAWMEKIIKFR